MPKSCITNFVLSETRPYKNMKAELEYWSPRNETVVTESGFRYLDTKSVVKHKETIEAASEIELFEKFYKMNNRLRYCNGTYYKFIDMEIEEAYMAWLKSDDFNKKSFDLYYGNGVVD